MSSSPEQLEYILSRKIEKSLQSSPDDALLGFLAVDEETQRDVLHYLKSVSRYHLILQSLIRYPALTTYGLAVAASIGLRDEEVGSGAFYGAWQSAFGFVPTQSERGLLARGFVDALKCLGLEADTISPGHDLHWAGGCYLFQGAILPHFVEPLQRALESAQKVQPLPAPDDPERARPFAMLVAEKVHPAQTRLRKTLQSSVGSFLVRRLSQWLMTGDDALFPAHIQPLLTEQKTKGAFLRNPYIQFDQDEGRMLLALPTQTSGLADSETRWKVGGRSYRASAELPPIPLDELNCGDGVFEVVLSRLKDGREDCSYALYAGIDSSRGFRLFDAETGKEQKVAAAGVERMIHLALGHEYLVVLSESAEVKSPHNEEEIGDYRIIRFKAGFVEPSLVIETNRDPWEFKTKVRPGLYLTPFDSHRFQALRLIDGACIKISYGGSPDLECVLPSDHTGPAKLRFTTSLDKGFEVLDDCPQSPSAAGMNLINARELLERWVESLPPAIHVITVSLECGARTMSREFVHWQGLDHITIYGDFHCRNFPVNLASFTGLKQEAQSLLSKRDTRDRPELSLKAVGCWELEKWELPANRVKVTLLDPEHGSEELLDGKAIEILPNDRRIIQFRTGGLLPVQLTCDGISLAEVSTEKPVVSKFLTALTAEFGRTGTLKAEALIDFPGDRSWTVLHWQTPQTAKECQQELTEASQVVWLIRKVSITDAAALRIKLTDFIARVGGTDSDAFLPLNIPDELGAITEISVGVGFSCSVHRITQNQVTIRFSFDRTEMRGAIWVAELECLLSHSTVWQPIMSREGHGRLAVVRLVFIGGTPGADAPPSAASDLFWGKPMEALFSGSPAWLLKGDLLDQWLNGVQWLISWKYPTAVWLQNANRFKSLYFRLSSICMTHGSEERRMWWQHAVVEFQKHANEVQPVVMPCLLLSLSLEMTSTSLEGCEFKEFAKGEWVARALQETGLYESQARLDALGYVSDICDGKRLSFEFLSHFSGWSALIGGKPVKLGSFRYRDWSKKLGDQCKALDFSSDSLNSELMAANHLIACLTKARQRADVLLSVAEQEEGHWLSKPIARIASSTDKALGAIRSILGPRLGGAPADTLLFRVEQFDSLISDARGKEFLQALMASSCLVALATRATALGILSSSQAKGYLRLMITTHENESEMDEVLQKHISLVIGTAPELFSFYFLLFTFSSVKP